MRFMTLGAIALLLSTMAATAQTGGVGPVYQELQRQGFTQMHMVQDRNRIRITAQRGDEFRQLVYDATTGKLLWDNLNPDRDRTRDRLYQQDFDQDRDRLRDQDKDQDRLRDPTTHE